MTRQVMMAARVRSAEAISPTLRRVVLEPAEGGLFPTGAAGAHILLEMRHDGHIWRNAYSLVSSPEHRTDYAIIVRRVANSRGGSAYIHDHLQPGQMLSVGLPSNLFPLVHAARKHLMLAAGIGVTPFLSYLPLLAVSGTPFALHLRSRAEDAAAFRRLVAPWAEASVHVRGEVPALDAAALLAEQPLGTHLYLCGPERFMADMVALATALGWPAARIHQEHFASAEPGAPFQAVLARSGLTIEVPADQGLLDAIEAAGVDAPCLCRAGVCGECRLTVLEGAPEHRDHFLTAEERAAGAIMPCVSRAQSGVLVLDI
jgi:dimethylamine monooxygenase subunit B